MDGQQFCLKWDGFQSSVTSLFDQLRHDGELVDITLCCDGQRVRAHRMMLSACSPYFRQLIQENPCQQLVFFLKDTSAADLRAIIEFVYKGSVNVAQNQLASFIKTAETLQIRGLSGDDDKPTVPAQTVASSPAAKRRRLSEHDPPPAPASVPRPTESPNHTAAASSDPASPSPPVSSSPSSSSLPPLPHPLPPPAPLPASSAPPSAPLPPAQLPLPSRGVTEPVDPMVKVEKVDTLDDDVTALDDTLGYVAEFEGAGYAQSRGPLDTMAVDQMAGALSQAPGPSQRIAEDGSTQGAPFECDVCHRRYKYRTSLHDHRQHHEGRTVCQLCGHVASTVYNLRLHLRHVHRLACEEARAMTGYGLRRGHQTVSAAAPPSLGEMAVQAACENVPVLPQNRC